MSFTLRPYQTDAAEKGIAFLRQPLLTPAPLNGIIVIPTGGGKSLVIGEIVRRIGLASIVFQPSKEILEQNAAKIRAYGYQPGIFSASAGSKKIAPITLATIGSVIRHIDMFRHVRYAVIDECHLVNAKRGKEEDPAGMYDEFIQSIPGLRVLGVTATPYRLSTDGYGGSILKFLTRTRPRIFHKVVHVVQNSELVRDGYWAKLDYKQVKTGFREDRLRLNSTGADYTDDSVRQHFRELGFPDQIVRCVHRLHELGRRGTLLFTRFVEESEYVASQIPGARVVTAQTSKREREQIIEGFRNGSIPLLANVGVFVVGFDYPALANVILAAPTQSLARYYQMVGRVVRPHPDKDVAFVVDMVGSVAKFGKVEDLTLVEGEHEKWHVEANGKQLTNVYFGKPPPKFIPGRVQPPPISKNQISFRL